MREIMLNICITAIALSLFKTLIPEGGPKKQVGFLVTCFFLSSSLFFVTSGKANIDFIDDINLEVSAFEKSSPRDFEQEYKKAREKSIEKEMAATISRVLSQNNIFPEKIYVNVNISEEMDISINEIRLVFLGGDIEDINDTEDAQNAANDELEILKRAMHIVQKEVGDDVFVTGELKQHHTKTA